jgi:hypothetical protein
MGFERGTTLPFRVTTYGHLGRINEVQVRLAPELSCVGQGWLLAGPGTALRRSLTFHCAVP